MSEQDAGVQGEGDWESIPDVDAAEIDRVIAALNTLMEQTTSPTVLEILEDVCCDLAELVDVEDEEDGELSEAA